MTHKKFQASSRWAHIAWSVASVLWLAGAAVTLNARGEQSDAAPGTLHRMTVTSSGHRVVVSLAADRTLDGALEAIDAQPRRLFIDLKGVVPEVDGVTDVNRGVVQRVRVALNRATPPVTRVVLDLQGAARYALERDPAGTLRIIVDDVMGEYTTWLTGVAATIERLLGDEAARRSGRPGVTTTAHDLDRWTLVQADVASVTPPRQFEQAHLALANSARLGLETALDIADPATRPAKPSAALAGANLSLRLSEELARLHTTGTPRTQ